MPRVSRSHCMNVHSFGSSAAYTRTIRPQHLCALHIEVVQTVADTSKERYAEFVAGHVGEGAGDYARCCATLSSIACTFARRCRITLLPNTAMYRVCTRTFSATPLPERVLEKRGVFLLLIKNSMPHLWFYTSWCGNATMMTISW